LKYADSAAQRSSCALVNGGATLFLSVLDAGAVLIVITGADGCEATAAGAGAVLLVAGVVVVVVVVVALAVVVAEVESVDIACSVIYPTATTRDSEHAARDDWRRVMEKEK
jgi:hypothetical protein